MKEFLIGMVAGAILFIPAGALAGRVVQTPTTNHIYDIGDSSNGDISVFDDQDNKCYVVNKDKGKSYEGGVAISCIKR